MERHFLIDGKRISKAMFVDGKLFYMRISSELCLRIDNYLWKHGP